MAAALPAFAEEDPALPAEETAEPVPTASEGTDTTGSEPAAPSSTESSGTDSTTATVQAAARKRDRREFGERELREGMRGRDVRILQRLLGELGFPVAIDGLFGRRTERQVKRYERWRRKRVNGVVTKRQAAGMRDLVRRGIRYRRHVFPVRGAHDYGGAGSRFGAPRSGHTHMGQDIAAAQGTRLVAVHEGRVVTRQYQAGGAGYYVVIHSRDGSDSVYMHLMKRAVVAPGERVMAGQKIGRVGTTGSSTGPHLHFELWTHRWYDGGHAYDPLPKLLKWDRRT